jgi:hypothetical protein
MHHPSSRSLICHKRGLDQRIPGLGQHIPGLGQRKRGLVHGIRDLGQQIAASDPRPEASLETNQAWVVADEPFQHRPLSRFVLPQASNALPQVSNALPQPRMPDPRPRAPCPRLPDICPRLPGCCTKLRAACLWFRPPGPWSHAERHLEDLCPGLWCIAPNVERANPAILISSPYRPVSVSRRLATLRSVH